MNMHKTCENYIKSLKEYSRDIQSRYMTRRISFFNRDIAENLFSLGYVETVTAMEHGSSGRGSFFSDDEIIDEKYETLEMQLKQIGPTRRNNVPVVRKTKVKKLSNNYLFRF